MTTLSPKALGLLLACLVLGSLLLPVHADNDDNRDLIKDAHHQLSQALNLGGPTPSDADRTTALNAAMSDLKDMIFGVSRADWARDVAVKDIKSAISMVARGDSVHDIEDKIRDADSIVRDLEG